MTFVTRKHTTALGLEKAATIDVHSLVFVPTKIVLCAGLALALSEFMRGYKFTLTYPEKKNTSQDNKIAPLVRKCNGKFESKYNYEDNETIVTVIIEKKEDKIQFEKALKEPHFSFLTLEKVFLTLDDD